jgi:hypothetical protein
VASLAKRRGKTGVIRRVLFKAADGQRKTIYLGEVTKTQADTILAHVNHLERCVIDGSAPPTQTAAWLAEISDTLHAKLVAKGLTAPKVESVTVTPTLGELVAAYKERPHWRKVKPKTRSIREHAFNLALSYFGADRPN